VGRRLARARFVVAWQDCGIDRACEIRGRRFASAEPVPSLSPTGLALAALLLAACGVAVRTCAARRSRRGRDDVA